MTSKQTRNYKLCHHSTSSRQPVLSREVGEVREVSVEHKRIITPIPFASFAPFASPLPHAGPAQ
jgi:hypothetical protein